jgi:hypothetical protein
VVILWFSVLKQTLKVGLIEGRHPMPVDEYIFESLPREGSLAEKIPKLTEKANEWIKSKGKVKVDLYVTGMTPVLTAFLRAWGNQEGLSLLHFDASTKEYWREEWT